MKIKKINGWKLSRDGVSQGFLRTFAACREQTRLVYKELWTSHLSPIFLEFGSCCHWILKMAYKKVAPLNRAGIRKLLQEYDVLWKKNNPKAWQKQVEQQTLIYGLAEESLTRYFERWNGDFPGLQYKYGNSKNITRPEKWLGLEKTWSTPYTIQENIFLLRGMFDGVFLDAKKRIWLFETKCLSVIQEENILDLLPSDIQVMFYLLAIALLYKKKPAGVLYNIIRRPGQVRNKTESLKDFLGRVRKDLTDDRRLDHYFKRYQMVIHWNEIEDWTKQYLNPLLLEVRDWDSGKSRHWTNFDALISKYGRCSMFLPIVKKDFGTMFRRSTVFNELASEI